MHLPLLRPKHGMAHKMKKSVSAALVLFFMLFTSGCLTVHEKRVLQLKQDIELRQLENSLSNLAQEYNNKQRALEYQNRLNERALRESDLKLKTLEDSLKTADIERSYKAKELENSLRNANVERAGKEIDNEIRRTESQRKNYENHTVFINK